MRRGSVAGSRVASQLGYPARCLAGRARGGFVVIRRASENHLDVAGFTPVPPRPVLPAAYYR